MYEDLINWTNANSGFLTLILFVATIVLGLVSGVFRGMRRKPLIRVELIPTPSFVCTFKIEEEFESYPVHKTGIAIYLKLTNVGSVSTNIATVMVGYRCNYKLMTRPWWKYNVMRFWLRDPTTALSEFGVDLKDGRRKVYPFLLQRSPYDLSDRNTFLRVGDAQNGMVYFEQESSFGGHFPYSFLEKVNLKVRVKDSFGRRYDKRFSVPMVGLEYANIYNKDFGSSVESLSDLLPDKNPIGVDELEKSTET